MNVKKNRAFLFSAIAGSLFAPLANAAGTTVTFSGSVQAVTCDVSAGGEAGGAAFIKMPDIKPADLATKSTDLTTAVGKLAGTRQFTLNFAGCSGSLAGVPSVSVSGNTLLNGNTHFTAQGSSPNVGIVLSIDSAGTKIVSTTTPIAMAKVDVVNTAVPATLPSLNLFASYSTPTAVPLANTVGNLKVPITFDFQYN
jgi:type 1 fimbria pilin